MSATRAGLLKAMRHRTMSPSSTPLSFLGSSCIAQKRYASHGEHFNEPSGLLFGELPRKDGSKRQREDWELIWYWGMGGSLVLGFAIFWFRPDTSISTWALDEAKRRLEARGDSARYIPSPESRVQQP